MRVNPRIWTPSRLSVSNVPVIRCRTRPSPELSDFTVNGRELLYQMCPSIVLEDDFLARFGFRGDAYTIMGSDSNNHVTGTLAQHKANFARIDIIDVTVIDLQRNIIEPVL